MNPIGTAELHRGVAWDNGLALQAITGQTPARNRLFRLVAERIRLAAAQLKLSGADLHAIFGRHSIFEGLTTPLPGRPETEFIIVETHHLIQGKVGKGALKIVFPKDLLEESEAFQEAEEGAVELRPPAGQDRWPDPAAAEAVVKATMREFMTGESLSMSLKCQATGAPFAGSEGLVLCALRVFEPATGRYFLKPALAQDAAQSARDKELIEHMMNSTAALLTRAGRIAHSKIVHAAETNSTLTARLGLQLPTNVVEGHLRTLLREEPEAIIGDDDMTARLREILADPAYRPTACALATAAATMQMEHSVLLPASRDRLRQVLAQLPAEGSPAPAQYREISDIFFGTGEVQQNEDQLYHHRDPILRSLSIALSMRRLEDCGDPQLLAFYLKTLLDNQRVMLEAAALKRLPPGSALPVDWFDRAGLLSPAAQSRLAGLMPPPQAPPDDVRRRFTQIVEVLSAERAQIPRQAREPLQWARADLLELALSAITNVGEVVPPVERLLFFTLPYTYECVTPKLAVVTRKPVAICGSALRPEAMAVGAVMAIEIFLKKTTRINHPLRGMTVAIEGLGNAGKNVARIMMEKGAVIVGVSDSQGAAWHRDGFSEIELAALIAHKNAGRSLNTFHQHAASYGLTLEAAGPFSLYSSPALLKKLKADILVLTAIPGSIHENNAPELRFSLVCELTGAAVTSQAKAILKNRQVHVIPDNLASSGGLLVSLSEMLQNGAGQNWHRSLEEYNLAEQLTKSFEAVLRLAKKHDLDVATASDMLAVQRMREWAAYRDQLEQQAALLRERILRLGPSEEVLLVADNDEDGVASAAIMHGLVAQLLPGAERQIQFLNESLRGEALLTRILRASDGPHPIRQVFVLDRALPQSDAGKALLGRLAGLCQLTVINNHNLAANYLVPSPQAGSGPRSGKTPAELGILLISPQTLRAAIPTKEFSTAMVLKEVAHQLVSDEQVLGRIDWQAAVGSYLDAPAELQGEALLFYTQFNPDKVMEAARAIRIVTRAGGFLSAIHALVGVVRPERLETNEAWGHFMAEFRLLDERVQVLVEKIVLENRRKPFTSHFFTHDEVASPTPIAGSPEETLDLYDWISEHLTKRGNLAEKPIIVGQVIRDPDRQEQLGVRIRSPRGVELMEAGLPKFFVTGGLPNTAVARIPLDGSASPEQQFHRLVDDLWMKTTHPMYLGSIRPTEPSPLQRLRPTAY